MKICHNIHKLCVSVCAVLWAHFLFPAVTVFRIPLQVTNVPYPPDLRRIKLKAAVGSDDQHKERARSEMSSGDATRGKEEQALF